MLLGVALEELDGVRTNGGGGVVMVSKLAGRQMLAV